MFQECEGLIADVEDNVLSLQDMDETRIVISNSPEKSFLEFRQGWRIEIEPGANLMIDVRISIPGDTSVQCPLEHPKSIDFIRMLGHKPPGYIEWRDRDGMCWVTHESMTTWGHGKTMTGSENHTNIIGGMRSSI